MLQKLVGRTTYAPTRKTSSAQIRDNLRCIRSAFSNRIETYIITEPNKECFDIALFQQSIKEQVINLLQEVKKKT